MALQPYPSSTTQPQQAPNYLGMLGGLIKKGATAVGSALNQPAPTQTAPKPAVDAFGKPIQPINWAGYQFGGTNSPSAPMGVQAKAPEQLKAGPNLSIPTGQVKQTSTPTSPTSTNQVGGNTPAPQSNGTLNQNFNMQAPGAMAGNGQPSQVVQPPSVQSGPYSVNSGLYGQLIASMANQSQHPGQPYTDAMGQYNQIADQIKQSQFNEANAIAQDRLNPIPIGDQTGRQAVIQNQYQAQQGALGSRLGAASNVIGASNTQQGLLQGLLQQAAAGAAPQQYSPGNYALSPLQGGAPTVGAGQQQGINSATNWAIAQQNISQGQQYQGQAQQISNSLQLLQAIRPQLTNFMQNAGLNTDGTPIVNTQINKINQQTNPQAYATSRALISEVTSFVQQMLQSQGGMTPTDAGNLVASYDFSQLTPGALDTFLQNMETAGNYRLSQAQSASQAGYGANSQVGAPAQGANANTSGGLQTGGATSLNTLPDWLKALGGIGAGTAAAVGNTLQNQAGAIIGGGVAEKVLGL